jgi:hypothetical protein
LDKDKNGFVEETGWIKSYDFWSNMDTKPGEVYYQDKTDSPGPYITANVHAHGKLYLSSNQVTITVIEVG